MYENDIIIFLLSEQVKDEDAFSFLYEIKNAIFKEYSAEELSNNSQLNKAKEILKIKMKYYNSHPIETSEGKLIDNLNLAKGVIFDNIESLLDRNDKIDMIINESNQLKDSTNILYIISDLTRNFENKESERKNRYIILAISLFLIILILIYII